MRTPNFAVLCLALGATTPLGAQTVRVATSPPPEQVRTQNDPVLGAYRVFERTGHARVIDSKQARGYVVFPFGHERAVVRCPRLNACLVMLEAGEALTDQPLAGDTERWIIETSATGSGQHSPLIVIKPQDCDLSTNVLVPTTRRVYELGLVSDPCEDNGGGETYTRQVKFWYPDDMGTERARESGAEEPRENVTLSVPRPTLRPSVEPIRSRTREAEPPLNRNYDIDRGWFLGRKDYPWIPAEIFDDGTRTYIVFPETAGTSELPILYELEGENRQMLNYVIQGDTIVADRVLEKGVLIVGTGDGQREIEFTNRGARKEDDVS